MRRKSWVIVVIVLLGAAIAAYFFLQRLSEPTPETAEIAFPRPVPTARPVPPPAPILPPAEPAIIHPLEATPSIDTLPDLDHGDVLVRQALYRILEKKWKSLLLTDHLIHKLVVTIDNLPRKDLPARVVPLKRVPGAFITSGEGDERTISTHNPERYTAYIQLFEGINSEKLVSLYRQFYPLFQRAYAAIGFPNAYFNDRLVVAIDDLLAAPEIDGPIRLVQPKVLYQFADPDLAERSSGQKIMIRMGRDNAMRLKVKLREIRQLVAVK